MQPRIVHNSITTWAAEDRPREKMASQGRESLTDVELLAMLLATGTRELSAIDLARQLVRQFGGLPAIARATASELMQVRGVGRAKASTIVAAFELSRRRDAVEERRAKFSDPKTIAKYLIPKVGDRNVEVFYVLYLSNDNTILFEHEIFRGGISNVTVDGRMIFREAVIQGASSVIVCHNHPSGKVSPSRSDDELTKHLIALSEIAGIRLLDHIIVAHNSWYSYSDQGLLGYLRSQVLSKIGDELSLAADSYPRQGRSKY